jgi:uncharacterized repeat protein (TIGR01451 family)
MRVSHLILSATLATLLGGMSLTAYAVEGAIKITSIAEVESEVMVNGKKEMKRAPVTKAVPGTEIIFTNHFENVSTKAASDVAINNAIPNSTEYKAGSAFGADCDIQFSVDSGKKFGHAEELKIKDADGTEHTALAKEYTNIRWTYKVQLPAGKSSEVGFRAAIK